MALPRVPVAVLGPIGLVREARGKVSRQGELRCWFDPDRGRTRGAHVGPGHGTARPCSAYLRESLTKLQGSEPMVVTVSEVVSTVQLVQNWSRLEAIMSPANTHTV